MIKTNTNKLGVLQNVNLIIKAKNCLKHNYLEHVFPFSVDVAYHHSNSAMSCSTRPLVEKIGLIPTIRQINGACNWQFPK